MENKAWDATETRQGVIEFTFVGKLSTVEGTRSAELLAKALQRGPVRIVFNLEAMTGYETGARTAWQNILFPQRKNILTITMRGGNALVRLGGTVLGMALGCPVVAEK